MIKIEKNIKLTLWTDYYGRVDVYWFKNDIGETYICSGKDMFPESIDYGMIDQKYVSTSF